MADPVLVVRVAANITELRKNLLEGGAVIDTTKRDLAAMANAFDGSRIISQANAVQAQISALGGVTNLTASEQRRANMVLDDALAKYQALGKEAPPGMLELADATRSVADNQAVGTANINSASSAYRQFDGVLQSMGINIGPFVKGIEDIAGAAGKSVSEVGLLGTAGLALGAGYAGWKVGRAVADFFDLDEKIANATARLMGYGDVAAETAGAKQDVINRAIAKGAAESISYTEAIQFNIDAMRASTEAAAAQTRELTDLEKAWNDTAETTGWYADEGEILGTVINGIVTATGEAIQADEAYRSNLVFTTETIGEQADSLDVLAAKKKADAVASREAAQAAEEAMKVFKQSFTSDIQSLGEGQLQAIRGGAQDDGKIWQKLKDLEAAEARGPRGFFEGVVTRDQYVAANEMTILLAQLRKWAQGQQKPPGFEGGVTNFGGGAAIVGERGPELVTLPRGSNVTPNHALGGPSITIAPGAIQLMFPVMNDPRAMNELVNLLGDAFMQRLRMSGQVQVGA